MIEKAIDVSVIIPIYESHKTLKKCLRSLERQTFREFEAILIDSSPTDDCERIVREGFPSVKYEHVRERMLPHEARNYGVKKSTSSLCLFTDPDIYASPDWIANLLEDHKAFGDVIVGSVSCYGNAWLDLGAHLAKFDMWLPGGDPRPIEIAPTLNLLCPRTIYDAVGGFQGQRMIGDSIFSWEIAEAGYRIHFSPRAEVLHHHVTSWSGLLRERFSRGREFGQVRVERNGWNRTRILLHLLVTISPLRWLKMVARTLRHARAANVLAGAIITMPVIASSHGAWLAGEARGFLSSLLSPVGQTH